MKDDIIDFFHDIDREEILGVYLPVAIGSMLLAIGQNLFIIPGGILAGGIGGISLILEYSLSLPAGIGYFLLNIPMVILALKKLSLKFTLQSFFSVIVFTITQIATVGLTNVINLDDTLLYAIFGAVIRGVGAGLIYRNGASALGTDVISILVRRAFNFSLGTVAMAIDTVIMLFSSFLYGIDVALYTIISLYLTAKLSDQIMMGVGERKNVMIVTKEYEKISNEIMKRVNRGVTLLDGTGAYTHSDLKVVFTVCTNREIVKIRNIIDEYDLNGFMTITDSSQVTGKGFKNLGS